MKDLKIELNEQQIEAVDKMCEWARHKGFESTFILSGSAGTGKTTVANEFIRKCGIHENKIAVSAPTHKAKRVIEKITGLQGHTLQGLLGLRPDLDLADFDHNRPQFNPKADPVIGQYKLIIIDECSMVNKDLEEHLVKQSKIFGVKLLYLGDKNQLPPVKEKLSLTFINPTYKYNLTKIMRQSQANPLGKLLEFLREDIENNTFKSVNYLKKPTEYFNEIGEGFSITNILEDFQTNIDKYFLSNEFNNNFDYCRYLSWTNISVQKWNTYIRNKLFNTDEMLVEGDFLLSYKTYIDKDNIIITANSEEYVVKSIRNEFSSVIDCNCKIIDLYDADYNVIPHRVFIDKSSTEIFTEKIQEKIDYARDKRAWKQFYDFKAKYMLSQDLKKDNQFICAKDFDYGYGLTVHKSQGSTYNNVFVNVKDILRNPDSIEKLKLIYVALSRTKDKCFILI